MASTSTSIKGREVLNKLFKVDDFILLSQSPSANIVHMFRDRYSATIRQGLYIELRLEESSGRFGQTDCPQPRAETTTQRSDRTKLANDGQ